MVEVERSTEPGWRARITRHVPHPQHRNAFYLLLNTGAGAAAGVLFWLIFTRIVGLEPSDVGVGYTIVALGTVVGLLAKGGLDTAILRTVPGASRPEGLRLLGFGMFVGVCVALGLSFVMAGASLITNLAPNASLAGWALVAAIGTLLVVTWLQDAYFLAEGDARPSFHRNLVFSGARLLLPLPIVLIAIGQPVALTWAIALGVSAAAAWVFARRFPHREGRDVPRKEFLRTAVRNVSGSAAEFLPGLLLVPFVLAMEDATQAGYFGIAWTAASLLFLASAAVSRSALAEMVRSGRVGLREAIRRGALQNLVLIVPGAIAGAILAPYVLWIFGEDYAARGALTMSILCLSALVVAPAYFYLAVLRAQERPLALLLYPLAMIAALAILAPLLVTPFGLPGVALAWFAANTPLAAYAAWKLRAMTREVNEPDTPPPTVHSAPYPE